MADRADDVLELDKELIEGVADEQDQADTGQTDGEVEGEDGSEPFATFGEEAAPASEQDSSVIRGFRQKLRDLERENAQLRKVSEPKPTVVGNRPSLEEFEFDEDRHAEAVEAWIERKATAKRETEQAAKRNETVEAERAKVRDAYLAQRARYPETRFEEAEREVFETLPANIQGGILKLDRAADLVMALHASPSELTALAELAQSDPILALVKIGELKGKLQVMRKPPAPDRDVRGNKSPAGGTDKELARLEAEAAKTNDRSAVAAYKARLAKASK